jgi:deoxyribonuclease-4
MRIGRHMPTHSKLAQAADIARQIGCEAIQIFASNPTAWRPPTADPTSCAAFAEAARINDLDPVVLHAPYLINLGTPDDTIWEKSIALLTWTMQRGNQLGARFVVFHTGSHRGSGVEAGIARVAQGIERVLKESPTPPSLLLENDVGAGHSLGHSFEQLAAILALLPQHADRLGICLDTAHLWGAGHDISTRASTLQVLEHCDATFGLSRLKVLHLNDTEKALGSHRDVHTRLGEGVIGEEGLQTLLSDSRLQHVAVLMETPIKTDEHDKEDWEHDKTQIAKAKALLLRYNTFAVKNQQTSESAATKDWTPTQ